MEDRIMECDLKVDKNSLEYDNALLKKLVGLSIPTKDFDKTMKRIFRQKSSCELWWDNKQLKLWDGKEYHEVNYRCCPSSHKARHMFGLWLNRGSDYIVIEDGWLEAL